MSIAQIYQEVKRQGLDEDRNLDLTLYALEDYEVFSLLPIEKVESVHVNHEQKTIQLN